MARLAVVSGGGTGIGRATAGMLAGEGYDVIIVGRRESVLADAVTWIGPQASAVTADLTDPAQAAAVAAAVGDRAVDVLVNNAGAYVQGDASTPAGLAAQRGGGGPYSAAKAALHGYAYDLAAQLGPEGVTANVVSPGYVTGSEFFAGRMTEEGDRKRVDATLVGRAGEPADIAETVRWLAGPGGTFVTGQIIGVNGGSVLGR